jgi:23S rRNA (cytidine2498-2'-O)-methyltransferase
LGCRVIAVDRSELAPNLMKDRGVEFVKGDAFTFEPPPKKYAEESRWMVSDIIAYPDKIQELLEQWCGGHWASHLVVTVKFQGEMPAWEELDKCIQIAESHGYECRAKHFFNNKHEVTLMAVERSLVEDTSTRSSEQRNKSDILGKSIYPVTLPVS